MTTNQAPIRTPHNVNERRAAAPARPGGMPEVDLPTTTTPERTDPPTPPAPATPPTLAAIHEKLCKPFPLWAIEVKPGATTSDKSRALALAYVDPRQYQTRLDRLAGPDGWSVEYRALGERAMLCRLTILGVTREDVGESDANEGNGWTSATMQAFKRACAAFGMGRYLYSLPKPWVDYDAQRRMIKDAEGAARQIYAQAGLLEKAEK